MSPEISADAGGAPLSVTVLGSTGSVGCSTLDLIQRAPERFTVEALTANGNAALIVEQARRLRPRFVAVAEPRAYGEVADALAGTGIEVATGPEALVEAAMRPAAFVMAAIVGAAGLAPTLAAIRRGAVVGLANKETLVCAGALMMAEAHAHGATVLPVDSEHSAIFQVFDFARPELVDRIILTASGGPFRTASRAEMARATRTQALRHPNWEMGAKITIDSATLMNKGLEVIEAHHLFPVPTEAIEVIVHPQSVIHSMVSYVDGSVLAQLGTPDMRTPIAVALAWPRRMAVPGVKLDFTRLGALSFEPPDLDRFPALRLAREALNGGGSMPTILNGANEVAVHAFLAGRIGFLDICDVVAFALDKIPTRALTSLADVWDVDAQARRVAGERCATAAAAS